MKDFCMVFSRSSLLANSYLFLLAGVVVAITSGCAQRTVTTVQQRYFWPPVAGREKVEYIRSYLSSEDVNRGVKNVLSDLVFGKEPPVAIFTRPHAVASDGQGRLLVGDVGIGKVFVLDFVRHENRFLLDASGKNPIVTGFSAGIAVSRDGLVYVADGSSNRVLVFDVTEKYRTGWKVQGANRLGGIALDESRQRVYVTDTENHRIVIFSSSGEQMGSIGRRGRGPGEFNYPLALAVDGNGNLLVLDSLNARVQMFGPEGIFLRQFGERGDAPGSFQMAKSLAVSPSGHVYVTDSMAHKIVVFDLAGNYLLTLGGKFVSRQGQVAPGGFYMPAGIAVDHADQIWVADSMNRAIHQFQYLNPDYLRDHPILPGQAVSVKGSQ